MTLSYLSRAPVSVVFTPKPLAMSQQKYFRARCFVIVAAFLLVAGTRAAAEMDPAKILGPEVCGDCHKLEYSAWQAMKHSKTFDDLHRRPAAKEISGKLGIANIKADGTCAQCHYTFGDKGPGRPIAGVSCERCHSGGRDWVKLHNEKGQREEAVKMGFISPSDTYKIASNCFSCHTVPNENLVNTGGHQAGSPIELASWSQGEVRHHFKKGSVNTDATPERRRMLYLVGRIVDLEYSLRGVANATERATYAVSMAGRAKAATAEVQKIFDVHPTDELKAVLAAAAGAKLKLNNKDEIMVAVEAISVLGQKISDTYQGADLAALDPLIPTTLQGTPFAP